MTKTQSLGDLRGLCGEDLLLVLGVLPAQQGVQVAAEAL
jgi:hypothetical protein